MSDKAISVWLGPDRVFDGTALRDGMALGVADGVIRALSPVAALPVGQGYRIWKSMAEI